MIGAVFGPNGLSAGVIVAIGAALVVLLGLVAWTIGRRDQLFLRSNPRRRTRLAVLDATAVDDRRRLLLVRRDGVEHLLMIGGPTDIVVERGIPVPDPQARRPQAEEKSSEHVVFKPLAPPVPPSADSPEGKPGTSQPPAVTEPSPTQSGSMTAGAAGKETGKAEKASPAAEGSVTTTSGPSGAAKEPAERTNDTSAVTTVKDEMQKIFSSKTDVKS